MVMYVTCLSSKPYTILLSASKWLKDAYVLDEVQYFCQMILVIFLVVFFILKISQFKKVFVLYHYIIGLYSHCILNALLTMLFSFY